jgi:hypothetical protein
MIEVHEQFQFSVGSLGVRVALKGPQHFLDGHVFAGHLARNVPVN